MANTCTKENEMHLREHKERRGSVAANLPHTVSFDLIDWVGVVFDAHGKNCFRTAQPSCSSNSTFAITILKNITRNCTTKKEKKRMFVNKGACREGGQILSFVSYRVSSYNRNLGIDRLSSS